MSIDELRATYYTLKVHNEGQNDKLNDCRQQLIAALNAQSDDLKRKYNIGSMLQESVKATYQRLQKELTARHKREQEELTALRLAANKAKKIIDSINAEIQNL
jgi:ABC-type phosphate transport system auxiliary subunit